MPRQHLNDIELYYDLTGDGDDTIVLVHGGWTEQLSWQFVVPAFAERQRVLSYDRRGHSRSVGSARAQASRHQHELDLAALIETLDLGAITLVGNSYGGSISLGLASRRPDLVRCVIFVDNSVALETYRRLGFVAEGTMVEYGLKKGKYLDAHLMARLNDAKPSSGSE